MNISPKVKQSLADYQTSETVLLESRIAQIATLLRDRCHSEIQQLLLVTFVQWFNASQIKDSECTGFIAFPNVDRFLLRIALDHEDFVFTVEDWNWKKGKSDELARVRVCVRLGSASNDTLLTVKNRLQTVMQFTSIQFFSDPENVATEVEGVLVEEAQRFLND